jgi:hypothetical protein
MTNEETDHDDVAKELAGAAEAADVSDEIAKAAGHWIRRFGEFNDWYAGVADQPGGVTEEWQMSAVLGPASSAEAAACRALRAYRAASETGRAVKEPAVLDAFAKCCRCYLDRMTRGVPKDDR